ncbi:MAG: hypothetical protein KF812_01745 [Fimbriimonadaceae bacterium]|nr:hypothetical protein [Fimbriimonadaceae bacterium]
MSSPGSKSVFDAAPYVRSGAHAFLLFGTEGAPLKETAAAMSALWTCEDQAATMPCDECPPCRARRAGGLVDAQVIEPMGNPPILGMEIVNEVKGTRADNFEGVPLRKFLRTRPMVAPKKIVSIHDIHRANKSAANALLKTIEEPPDYSRLVLTTTSLSSVLATIRSRCVCLAVEKVSSPAVAGVPEWGHIARDEEETEHLELLDQLLEKSVSSEHGECIRNGHLFRKWADEWRERRGLSARQGIADALTFMAEWCLAKTPESHDNLNATLSAHRLILGNVQEGLVLDVLFMQWAGTRQALPR